MKKSNFFVLLLLAISAIQIDGLHYQLLDGIATFRLDNDDTTIGGVPRNSQGVVKIKLSCGLNRLSVENKVTEVSSLELIHNCIQTETRLVGLFLNSTWITLNEVNDDDEISIAVEAKYEVCYDDGIDRCDGSLWWLQVGGNEMALLGYREKCESGEINEEYARRMCKRPYRSEKSTAISDSQGVYYDGQVLKGVRAKQFSMRTSGSPTLRRMKRDAGDNTCDYTIESTSTSTTTPTTTTVTSTVTSTTTVPTSTTTLSSLPDNAICSYLDETTTSTTFTTTMLTSTTTEEPSTSTTTTEVTSTSSTVTTTEPTTTLTTSTASTSTTEPSTSTVTTSPSTSPVTSTVTSSSSSSTTVTTPTSTESTSTSPSSTVTTSTTAPSTSTTGPSSSSSTPSSTASSSVSSTASSTQSSTSTQQSSTTTKSETTTSSDGTNPDFYFVEKATTTFYDSTSVNLTLNSGLGIIGYQTSIECTSPTSSNYVSTTKDGACFTSNCL